MSECGGASPSFPTAAPAQRSLPTGTVTFLLTDIEGSTRILKQHPDDAADLFERHNEIVRAAIEETGGHELGTEGDAFAVAFDDVDSAMAASARVQRDLAAETWPVGAEIRVRIGVHAGLAVPRNGNYVALAIHQAARVINAAHGGQTLITRSSLDRRRAPAPVVEVPLGRFRVRDFDGPVELVRLDAIGAPPNERPLRVPPADGHNLMRLPNRFVGRRDTLDRVVSLVGPGAIVSVVGPGGMGKTRLAVEVGFETVERFPDGVWIVDLADLSAPGLVASAIADTLGLGPNAELPGDLQQRLGETRSLLIADNIETCLEECATLLPRLAGFGAAILTTGREPMNVPAETVWRLGALPTAPRDSPPAEISASAGVTLFVDRARVARPDFDPAPVLADIAAICDRLDGLPLAIEIAAARVAVLSVPEILAGLDDRFTLLRSSERSLPSRQRTLRGLLQGSYDLLTAPEQAALRRLAAFAGSFTLRTAEVVVADAVPAADGGAPIDSEDVPELVWSLVDKSLLVIDQTAGLTSYRLLESVREFAYGLLADAGEAGEATERIGRDLVDRVGPDQSPDRRWLGDVAGEIVNIAVAADRLASNDQELAQTLACTIGAYRDATQQFSAGIAELSSLADRLREPTPVRPVMLATLADLHLRRGDHETASRLVGDAIDLRDRVGTPAWAGTAIERTHGEILLRRGDHDAAAMLAREVLGRGPTLAGQARMWNLLGIAALTAGDLDTSDDAFRHELDAYRELDVATKVASANGNVAELALRRGDTAAAAAFQLASLDGALAIGQPVMLAFSAVVAARLAGRRHDWVTAVRLQAAAVAGLDAAGHQLYAADAEELGRLLDEAREQLPPDELAAETAAGAALDPVLSAELARQVLERVIVDPSGGDPTESA